MRDAPIIPRDRDARSLTLPSRRFRAFRCFRGAACEATACATAVRERNEHAAVARNKTKIISSWLPLKEKRSSRRCQIATAHLAQPRQRSIISTTHECTFTAALHGLAFGEKNPIGKSRAVRKPAGASRITGIEFTTTEAVAISPCVPPGITRLMFGWPFKARCRRVLSRRRTFAVRGRRVPFRRPGRGRFGARRPLVPLRPSNILSARARWRFSARLSR